MHSILERRPTARERRDGEEGGPLPTDRCGGIR